MTSSGALDTDGFPEADGVYWTQAAGVAETTDGGMTEHVSGAPVLEEELGGLRFGISPDAFFQTNTDMAERLYGIAAEYAELRGWDRVFDLYCGIGTIGLTLARARGERQADRPDAAIEVEHAVPAA